MNILLVQNFSYLPTRRGSQRANRLLLEGLAERNHSCRVVAPMDAGAGTEGRVRPSQNVFLHHGVEVRLYRNQLSEQLREQIRLFQPTWTLVSEELAWSCLTAALETSPGRVVFTAHSQAVLPFGPECFLADPTRIELLRRTAGIITVSKYVQDYLWRWGGLSSTVLYPPAYGSGPFPRWGCFDRGFVTLVNPSPIKGLAIFLELAQSLPDVPFAAVPTWATRTADLDALRQLRNVQMLEPAEDIDEILSQTRILLVPSLWGEAFGYIVVEAMLRGIPVLASNLGGLVEAKLGVDYLLPVKPIERYEERLDERLLPVAVVPEQDVGPWSEALRQLLTDRGRYDQVSDASREAALRFVSGLGIEPFEQYLQGLRPAPAAAVPSVHDREGTASAGLPANLSRERLELLALLLRKNAAPALQAIPRLPRNGSPNTFPLSFAQQRLWFLDQLEPGSPVYINSIAWQLSGPLDREILARSLNEIVQRHEAWRTTFQVVDGQPAQVIASVMHLPLPVVDLRDLPQAASAAEVRRLAVVEANRPFDLARGPLVRGVLLRTADAEHVLLLTVHHIVSDHWSGGIVRRELGTLYQAFSKGRPTPLPDLPIQYADFASWQRDWLQGEVLEKQLSYWRRQLTGPLPLLDLPADRPRPAFLGSRGALQVLLPPRSLFADLEALSRRERVTLFMTLLAAFQVLLHRYTGQEDILVGSPIAGRTRLETEKLIGFFVNTLVLRGDLSGNPTFVELLARVREVTTGAYAHQDLSFEKLVEELHLPRDRSRSALFQVMFVLQNAPAPGLDLPGVAARRLKFDTGTAKFDLTLTVVERAEGMTIECEYSTDLFDAATITRMLGHFRILLEGIVSDPGQRLAGLPLLTRDERQQLLVAWNATDKDPPRQACIHELFEAQAERAPDAVALVWSGEELSYRQLNRQANQLAHSLRRLGVGPDTVVGIAVERTPQMVIGLLGILKAGGAYLPLDPQYPPERLAFILQDTQTPVVLTQQSLRDRFREHPAHVLCLDTDWHLLAGESADNPKHTATAANLAYVIYTSGTTGQPKGVLVPHRGVIRLLVGVDYVRLDAGQTLLQLAPVSFDASTFEIWAALLHGGRLVLAPTALPSFAELEQLLKGHCIRCLWLTASLFNSIIDQRPEVLSGVEQLLIGGEALSVAHVERARAVLPATRLTNGYGPTESTTFACCFPIPGTRAGTFTSIPIGRPIANTRVYILDGRLQPVPVGVPGELYIGGDGLARGYLNRPALTAEKFIPDPFWEHSAPHPPHPSPPHPPNPPLPQGERGEPESPHPRPLSAVSCSPCSTRGTGRGEQERGGRLYKTGDRARFLADGNIEFLGRLDYQVKIRGIRIEPGEVEAVLNGHPAVRASAVVAREDVPGGKGLVAFVVRKPGQAATDADLRRFASQKVPAALVPAGFVFVDALPLTGQGKVDRVELQRRSVALPASRREFVPHQHALQLMLVAVWEELLDVRPIGIRDDFFELGGHSLLAVEMVARIERLCGRRLPLADLFREATIEHLARRIQRQPAGEVKEEPLVVVQAGGGKRPLFFLHGDFLGGGFYCRNLARHLGAERPFHAFSPRGVSGEHLLPTLEAVAAANLELVRQIQPEGPYLLGGYCAGALEAFEMARQLRERGERVDLVVLIAPVMSHSLPKVPPEPARTDLARLPPYDRRLIALRFTVNLCRNYLPRRYPGRVTIFQPGEPARGTAELFQHWQNLADLVEIHEIPGGHASIVTRHARTTAEQLSRCLHAIEDDGRK